MQREAASLGAEIVEREAALDRLFATRAAEPETVARLAAAIGERQGTLRYTHLKYHLAMTDVLTPEQVQRYSGLRGYALGHAPQWNGPGDAYRHILWSADDTSAWRDRSAGRSRLA